MAWGMSGELKKTIVKELERLKSADPVSDLRAAIQKGDYRFIGLMGYMLYVPGVQQDKFYQKHKAEFGVKVITGTSDFFEIPEQEELARVGGAYAEKYNQLLLKKIAGRSFQELLRENIESK